MTVRDYIHGSDEEKSEVLRVAMRGALIAAKAHRRPEDGERDPPLELEPEPREPDAP